MPRLLLLFGPAPPPFPSQTIRALRSPLPRLLRPQPLLLQLPLRLRRSAERLRRLLSLRRRPRRPNRRLPLLMAI